MKMQSFLVGLCVSICSWLPVLIMHPMDGGAGAAFAFLGGFPVAVAFLYYAIMAKNIQEDDPVTIKSDNHYVNRENLKEIIFALRRSRELSQNEMGKLLNVSGRTIRRWEAGTAIPTMDDIVKICNEFGIKLEDIFGMNDNETCE